MYFIKYAPLNEFILDPRTDDRVCIEPTLEIALSDAGQLTFKISPLHPLYEKLPMREAQPNVQVYASESDDPIFCGYIIDRTKDFRNVASFTIIGELSYLNDTLVRDYSTEAGGGVDGAPDKYLRYLIEQHNSRVNVEKQFEIGISQGYLLDPNNYIARSDTQLPTTANTIKTKLLESLGGYLRIRYEKGKRFLDYLASTNQVGAQSIEFGKNLLDYVPEEDYTGLYTVIVPRGAQIESDDESDTDQRYDITSLPDEMLDDRYLKEGDCILDTLMMQKYGRIEESAIYDDITIPENILTKALSQLASVTEIRRIQIKALDMHLLNPNIEQFQLGDWLNIQSKPNGVDAFALCARMKLRLDNPSANEYLFGTDYGFMSYTQAVQQLGVAERLDAIQLESGTISQEAKNAAQTATTAAQQAEEANGAAAQAAAASAAADSKATDAKSTADTAQQTATTAQSTAEAADTKATSAQATAEEAKQEVEEVSNNFFYDADGAHVATTPGDASTGQNARMSSTAFEVRDGVSVLSSFGDTLVDLGKNSQSSLINMCGAKGQVGVLDDMLTLFSDKTGVKGNSEAVLASNGSVTAGSQSLDTSRSATSVLDVLIEDKARIRNQSIMTSGVKTSESLHQLMADVATPNVGDMAQQTVISRFQNTQTGVIDAASMTLVASDSNSSMINLSAKNIYFGGFDGLYGRLADFPVEQGTMAGVGITWNYVKWASGKIECWGTTSNQSLGEMTGYGYSYYKSMTMANAFPVGFFVSVPQIFLGWNVQSNGLIVGVNVWTLNTTIRNLAFTAYSPANDNFIALQLYVYCIGRWK